MFGRSINARGCWAGRALQVVAGWQVEEEGQVWKEFLLVRTKGTECCLQNKENRVERRRRRRTRTDTLVMYRVERLALVAGLCWLGGGGGGMEGVGGEIEWRGGDRKEHILIGNVQNGGRSVLGLDEDVCVGGGGGEVERKQEHRQIHW